MKITIYPFRSLAIQVSLILIAFFAFASLTQAQRIIGPLDLKDSTQTQTIYFKNGDRLTVRILNLEYGRVTYEYKGELFEVISETIQKIEVPEKEIEDEEGVGEWVQLQRATAAYYTPDTSRTYAIELKQGTLLYGKVLVIDRDKRKLSFLYNDEVLEFQLRKIKKIYIYNEFTKKLESYVYFGDAPPSRNRLVIANTAFLPEKGQGGYYSVYGLAHIFDMYVTKNLTLTAGYILPDLINLQLKLSFEVDDKSSVGFGWFNFFGPLSNFNFGGPQLTYTRGTPLKYFNVSIGQGVYNDLDQNDFLGTTARNEERFLSIGGVLPISKRVDLIGEAFVVNGANDTVTIIPLMVGLKKRRTKLGLGVFIIHDGGDGLILPLLNYKRVLGVK